MIQPRLSGVVSFYAMHSMSKPLAPKVSIKRAVNPSILFSCAPSRPGFSISVNAFLGFQSTFATSGFSSMALPRNMAFAACSDARTDGSAHESQ